MGGNNREEVATVERELTITRVFNAPHTLIFQVWTQPKHFTQWLGPKDFVKWMWDRTVHNERLQDKQMLKFNLFKVNLGSFRDDAVIN